MELGYWLRLGFRTGALVVGLGLGGFALLLVGLSVPDGPVLDALGEGVDRGGLGVGFDRDSTGAADSVQADCTTLSLGVVTPPGQGRIREAAAANVALNCEELLVQLDAHRAGTEITSSKTYLRYWHGSAVFAPGVVATVGVKGLRALTEVALIGAVLTLGVVVRRIAGIRAAIALLLPFLLTIPLGVVARGVHQGSATVAALLGAAFVATIAARGASPTRLWFWSLGAGALFVYFDLLTVVPGTWLLCASLAAFGAAQRGAATGEVVRVTASTVGGWFVGYAGMWLMKWTIAALFLGVGRVRDDVWDQIIIRVDGDDERVTRQLWHGTKENMDAYFSRPFSVAIVVAVAALVALALWRGSAEGLLRAAIVALPVLLVPLWYEFASSHSQLHAWFTYRSIPMALGVVAMLAVSELRPAPAS